MLIYESNVGSHIENVIKSMKQMAIEHDNHVKTDFNGIEIIVNYDSDINNVIEAFHAEQDRLAEEYANSPKGQARIKEREDEHMRQIIRVEELWDNQPDWSNLNSVITWLEELEKCSMMNLQKDGIIELFESNGYFAGVNCGEDFKEDDKENWARWLIGQALECIRDVGAICQMFPSFAKEWRTTFADKQRGRGMCESMDVETMKNYHSKCEIMQLINDLNLLSLSKQPTENFELWHDLVNLLCELFPESDPW